MVRLIPLVVLAGCASLLGPAVLRWADPPPEKRTAPVLARRDECLKPPYALPQGKTLTLHGMRIEPRGDGPRELTFTAVPGVPLEADALLELEARNDAALRALDGIEQVGLSGCMGSQGKPLPCLSLSMHLCANELDRLAEQLAVIVANDPLSRGRAVVFHVALTGAAGPRCEADDPKCRPDPYASGLYRRGDRRGLLKAPPPGEPECDWDGECGRSSCGGDCLPWTRAHRPGTCSTDEGLRDAFCGCIEHRCTWFVQ